MSPDALREAVAQLARGALVAFPTETVYGLGADATNESAIRAVFAAKGRPADNPLIVHGASVAALERFAQFDVRAHALAAAYWPGPLTLVLPAVEGVSPLLRAGLPSVAVRVPDHPLALALLAESGPLVAPSANRSGRPSPTTAAHVREDLVDAVAMVLDGGPCRVGLESTVLDLTTPVPTVLRPGALTPDALAAVLGEPVASVDASAVETHTAPRAPGMKYRHYAPSVPVRIVHGARDAQDRPAGALVLTTARHLAAFDAADARVLEGATLYDEFRRAEQDGRPAIVIVAATDELSAALWDRIRKATAD
jgi:L-threonylcarbamoyladenylate synthase